MHAISCDVQRHVIKPVLFGYKWLDYSGNMVDKTVPKAFKNVKLLLKLVDVPHKIEKFAHLKGGLLEKSARAVNTAASLFSLAGATSLTIEKAGWISLPGWQVEVLEGVGFISCLAKIFIDLCDMRKLLKKSMDCVVGLNLVLKVASLALNILGAFVFLYGCEIKLLLLSISSLSFILKNYKFHYNEVISKECYNK